MENHVGHCAIYDPCSLSRCRHHRRRRRHGGCRLHDSWCRNLSLPVSSLSSIDDSRGPLITTIGDLSTTPRRVVRRSGPDSQIDGRGWEQV